jgi:hypothetical protein
LDGKYWKVLEEQYIQMEHSENGAIYKGYTYTRKGDRAMVVKV